VARWESDRGGSRLTGALSRRLFCLTTLAAHVAPASAASLDNPIAAIEAEHGGRLGVFARDTGTSRVVAYRADERFLLESTFKGPLAAMVLAHVDAGTETLDSLVSYGPHELVPASPVTAAHAGAGALPVVALVRAVLERSDNTAANLLLRRVGGPGALTKWLRASGDGVTVINRYEFIPGQTGADNTTTPRAIAQTAARISLGRLLKPSTRSLNNRWMSGNVIAMQRLRGGVPPDWSGLDRTGTSASVRNDYAIVWPPGRAPLVLAAYYEKAGLPDGDGEAVLRAVGAAVVSSLA